MNLNKPTSINLVLDDSVAVDSSCIQRRVGNCGWKPQPLGVFAFTLLFGLAAFSFGQGPKKADAVSSNIRFADSTAKSKLLFRHRDGNAGQNYLVEMVGAGLATFDADNDGWLDVYMLNGVALRGATLGLNPTDQLFLNRRDGTFADVTEAAGCAESGYGLGVTAGDFNNDGFEDLCIANYGADVMLQNNGDGTFSDVTARCGVADGLKFGAGVVFLDIDNDNDLDLFSANYVQFSYERHDKIAPTSFPYSPGPSDFPPEADSLFLNNGDGTFTDISKTSGVASVAGPSMGVIAGDFDGDGFSDIFVCCDGVANLFYHNDGKGKFTEEAIQYGLALDQRGEANGSMGVDAGDLDGDGLEDFVVTDYADQIVMHFRNLGQGLFEDVARVSQIGKEVLPHVKWGVGLVDFDCDGDRDAYICNGHLLLNAKTIDPRTDHGVKNSVMENMGKGTFRSVTDQVGEALEQARSSRGAAFDDLDNDGDIDCVVLNCNAEAQYLENTTAVANRWIELDLRGRSANRSAVGARVKLLAGQRTQIAEVRSGRGYQSHFGSRLHFGWKDLSAKVEVQIQWPDGKSQTVSELAPNQIHVIVQE